MPFRGVGFSRMDSEGNEIASLCISTIPGRKQVALYVVEHGVKATILAYFLNEQAAQEMVEILKTMVKRRRRTDDTTARDSRSQTSEGP